MLALDCFVVLGAELQALVAKSRRYQSHPRRLVDPRGYLDCCVGFARAQSTGGVGPVRSGRSSSFSAGLV